MRRFIKKIIDENIEKAELFGEMNSQCDCPIISHQNILDCKETNINCPEE